MNRKRWVCLIAKAVSKVMLSPFFKLEVHGVENVPKKSAFVLLPKHQRWEDIPLLNLATPRPLYYVAKQELFRNSFNNWFSQSLSGIPLNRQRPLESRRSLKTIIELLKDGEGVVIFPEGTYYRNKMGPGQVGIVRLILPRLIVPFIPVGIHYSDKRGRTLARVTFGRSFYADSASSAGTFLDHMMKEIAQLSSIT